jgi:hypothetical protein
MRHALWVLGLVAGVLTSNVRAADPVDVAAALAANDAAAADSQLNDVQRRFEAGTIGEIELRNAFRPIYDLTPKEAETLHTWSAAHPTSYAAHLAEGIYYKKRAQAARGDKFVSETSKEALDGMHKNLAPAKAELTKSLDLTKKPFLSLFHLIDIASLEGDRSSAAEFIAMANGAFPKNTLARNRYMQGLMPRWGGSYPEAEAFIAKSKSEGLPEQGVVQLEAIMHQDKGQGLEEHGDHQAARAEFVQALQLGKRAGGTFQVDFLKTARYYGCSGSDAAAYCQ